VKDEDEEELEALVALLDSSSAVGMAVNVSSDDIVLITESARGKGGLQTQGG